MSDDSTELVDELIAAAVAQGRIAADESAGDAIVAAKRVADARARLVEAIQILTEWADRAMGEDL